MLRVFWDEAVALDPAMAARDERHMALCRRGELAALWREAGLADVDEQPLTIVWLRVVRRHGCPFSTASGSVVNQSMAHQPARVRPVGGRL